MKVQILTVFLLALTASRSAAVEPPPNVVVWGAQTNVPANLTNAVAISADGNRTLALTADGRIIQWGNGATPVIFSGSNYVAISARGSLALRADGTVVSLISTNPTPVVGLSNVVDIAYSNGSSWALTSEGVVVEFAFSVRPREATKGLTNIVRIFGSGSINFHALTADSDLIGFFTQIGTYKLPSFSDSIGVATTDYPVVILLGNGSFTLPDALQELLATNAIALSGYEDNLALMKDGRIILIPWTPWSGTNPPPLLSNVVQLASGSSHNVALIGAGPPRLAPAVLRRTVTVGMPLNIYPPATGELPMHYQWTHNGMSLSTQTNA